MRKYQHVIQNANITFMVCVMNVGWCLINEKSNIELKFLIRYTKNN